MDSMKFNLLVGCSLLLWGCAQIRMVEGGPKDTIPPVLLASDTPDSLLNWKGQGFELTWDEYIAVQNVVDQITFSPPLQYPLNVLAKGKKVVVSWSDTLRSETTYQVDFGNSIVDITEGNPASLTRIWSTGGVLDSLELSGSVINGWTGQAVDQAVVQLLLSPFDLEKVNKPSYQVKTNKEGRFVFHCLPASSFYLLAFEDKNKSGRWEEGEWLDTDMNLWMTSQENTDISCVISQNVGAEPKIGEITVDSAGWAAWKWDPRWSMPQFEPSSEDEKWENNWTIERSGDSVLVTWVGNVDNAFHPLKLKFENGMTDSISVPVFIERWERNPYFEKVKERKVIANQSFALPLPYPSSGVQWSKWKWISENENEKGSGEVPVVVVKKDNYAVISTKGFLPGKYALEILPKAVFYQDLEWITDTIVYTIHVLGSEDIGQLQVKSALSPDFWWSLTDEKGKVQTISGEQLMNKGIEAIPGTYILRVVEEKENPQYWDGMNWKRQTEAEIVHVFPQPIVIRANWNQVLDWK
jgi:hypothetical protein